MEPDANLAQCGAELATAVEAALPGWVERRVAERVQQFTSMPAPDDLLAAARAAGERARDEVGAELRRALLADVDAQLVNPLAIVRRAVAYPTAVLRAAGVPEVVRDEFEERAFPDDVYALSPASFADVDPSLHEPGLVWGAAKAHAHLARHRRS